MGFIDKRSDNRGMKRVISPDGMKSIQVARIIRAQNAVEIHECEIKDDACDEDECVFIIKGEGYTSISQISSDNNADDNDDTDADADADGGQSTQDTGDEECYPDGYCIPDNKR